MSGNQMTENTKNAKWNAPITLPMAIFDIAVLWYYSFGGSIVLRPFVNVFWIVTAIIGIFVFGLQKFPFNRYSKYVLLMVLYLVIILPFSQDTDASLKYTLSLLLYLIIAIEITSNYQNIKLFLKVAFAYSLILLLISLIEKYSPIVYTALVMPFLPAQYNLDILTFIRNGSVNGFFNQTSSNAVAMSLGVGLATYNIENSQGRKVLPNLIRYAFLLAFFYGVILTVRRGSLFVVAAILAYIVYIKRGNGFTKALLAVAVIWLLVFGGLSSIPAFQQIIEKNQMYSVAGDISNGRFDVWARSLSLFAQKPIFGHGIDTYHLLGSVINAHNSYLQTLVELGAVGTVVFYAPFVFAFVQTIRYRKRWMELDYEMRALCMFSLFWQIYCFGDGVFEAIFASEITVFMMFIAQLTLLNIYSNEIE